MSNVRLLIKRMKIALRLVLLILAVTPLLAWFAVKPVRVVAPTVAGLICPAKFVCVEAAEKLPEATALYEDAVMFARKQVGPLQGNPSVVFCSTKACTENFGLGLRSAVTVGTLGTIIGPNAWKPYYVRHELIHHIQGQQFGVLRRIFMPSWLIEGMAYSLSQDPRPQLAEPWQQYRIQFNEWLTKVGQANMWQKASHL